MSPEDLQALLRTAIAEAVKLNPIEQRKLDEELAREKRKSMMMVQLGKIEEEAARAKRENCSHMRDAKTGDSVARNAPNGEWTTGGQAYQDGTAMVICVRCSSTWLFRPSPEYYNVILQNGLRGAPPPPEHMTICNGCFQLKPACQCKELYVKNSGRVETVPAIAA